MATVTIHPKSGDGDRTGPDGDDITRMFIVVLDAVGDSPISEVEERTVPKGAPHPTKRWRHLHASVYTQATTESRLIWLVTVQYAQPSLFSWLLDVDLGTETELAKKSLKHTDENGVVTASLLIGPRIYIPLKEGQTAYTHFTWTDRDNETLKLRFAGDLEDPIGQVIKPTGLERLTTRTSFTLSKRLRSLTEGNIQDIFNGRATVSDDKFLFQEPRTVLLNGISVRERDGSIDQRTDGTAVGLSYDVTVHFLVDKAGWTPQRVFDVYISEQGFESAVIARGLSSEQPSGPAFRDYHLYPTGSMNAFMTSLDRGWFNPNRDDGEEEVVQRGPPARRP